MLTRLLLIGGGLCVVLFCIIIFTFQYPKLSQIKSIEVKELDGNKLTGEAQLGIENPNFYSLSAKELHYSLLYRDTFIAEGDLPKGLYLPANKESLHNLPLNLSLASLFAVANTMLKKDSLKLMARMDGKFTAFGISKHLEIPFTFAPRDLLSQVVNTSFGENAIQFKNFEWKTSSLKETTVGFTLELKNPFDFPIVLEAANLELMDPNTPTNKVGNWEMEKPEKIDPKKKVGITSKVTISHLGLGGGMIQTVFTGSVKYKAQGKVTVKIADYPFELPINGTVIIRPASKTVGWE